MAKSPNKKKNKKPRLKHEVCKPCWELKYCPYGPLVEFFPFITDHLTITEVRRRYKSWITAVKEGELKTRKDIYKAIENILFLEPDRWKWINQFRPEDLVCANFGHVCPVFMTAEPFTETHEGRNYSRSIPRDVMLQVVRRDGQICRSCKKNVPDNEVEFDHIIPFSRGGPTTDSNLRLVCRQCNRKKKDSLKEMVLQIKPY